MLKKFYMFTITIIFISLFIACTNALNKDGITSPNVDTDTQQPNNITTEIDQLKVLEGSFIISSTNSSEGGG